MERKAMLMLLALGALALVSVPSVMFSSAFKKYFSFVGHWSVATVKPSRSSGVPPHHPRSERLVEPPQPDLRFARFSAKFPGAKDVRLAGDFNKWNPDSLALARKDGKTWEAVVPLPPGRYKYIYRVDGQDTLDPLNPDTDLEGGRKVSALTLK